MNRRTAFKSIFFNPLLHPLAGTSLCQSQSLIRQIKTTFTLGQSGEFVAAAAGDDEGISLILGLPAAPNCRLSSLNFKSGTTSEVQIGGSGYLSLQREAGGRHILTKFRYPSQIEVLSLEGGQVGSRIAIGIADSFAVSCLVMAAQLLCLTGKGDLVRYSLSTRERIGVDSFPGTSRGKLWPGTNDDVVIVDRTTASVHRITPSGERRSTTLGSSAVEESRRWLAQAASRHTHGAGVPAPVPILFLAHSVSSEGAITCIPAPIERGKGMRVLTFSSEGELIDTQVLAIPDRSVQPTLPVAVFGGRVQTVVFGNGFVYRY